MKEVVAIHISGRDPKCLIKELRNRCGSFQNRVINEVTIAKKNHSDEDCLARVYRACTRELIDFGRYIGQLVDRWDQWLDRKSLLECATKTFQNIRYFKHLMCGLEFEENDDIERGELDQIRTIFEKKLNETTEEEESKEEKVVCCSPNVFGNMKSKMKSRKQDRFEKIDEQRIQMQQMTPFCYQSHLSNSREMDLATMRSCFDQLIGISENGELVIWDLEGEIASCRDLLNKEQAKKASLYPLLENKVLVMGDQVGLVVDIKDKDNIVRLSKTKMTLACDPLPFGGKYVLLCYADRKKDLSEIHLIDWQNKVKQKVVIRFDGWIIHSIQNFGRRKFMVDLRIDADEEYEAEQQLLVFDPISKKKIDFTCKVEDSKFNDVVFYNQQIVVTHAIKKGQSNYCCWDVKLGEKKPPLDADLFVPFSGNRGNTKAYPSILEGRKGKYSLCLYDTHAGEGIVFRDTYDKPVTHFHMIGDRCLLTMTNDHVVKIWDVKMKSQLKKIDLNKLIKGKKNLKGIFCRDPHHVYIQFENCDVLVLVVRGIHVRAKKLPQKYSEFKVDNGAVFYRKSKGSIITTAFPPWK